MSGYIESSYIFILIVYLWINNTVQHLASVTEVENKIDEGKDSQSIRNNPSSIINPSINQSNQIKFFGQMTKENRKRKKKKKKKRGGGH